MSHPETFRVDVRLDADAHSADAIQRAAYRFADQCSLQLTREGSNFICALDFPGEADPRVVREFRIAVTDEVLRERIRNETRDVRNLILALAFANTGLVQDTPEP